MHILLGYLISEACLYAAWLRLIFEVMPNPIFFGFLLLLPDLLSTLALLVLLINHSVFPLPFHFNNPISKYYLLIIITALLASSPLLRA
jgi:hypothetical protein